MGNLTGNLLDDARALTIIAKNFYFLALFGVADNDLGNIQLAVLTAIFFMAKSLQLAGGKAGQDYRT